MAAVKRKGFSPPNIKRGVYCRKLENSRKKRTLCPTAVSILVFLPVNLFFGVQLCILSIIEVPSTEYYAWHGVGAQ